MKRYYDDFLALTDDELRIGARNFSEALSKEENRGLKDYIESVSRELRPLIDTMSMDDRRTAHVLCSAISVAAAVISIKDQDSFSDFALALRLMLYYSLYNTDGNHGI